MCIGCKPEGPLLEVCCAVETHVAVAQHALWQLQTVTHNIAQPGHCHKWQAPFAHMRSALGKTLEPVNQCKGGGLVEQCVEGRNGVETGVNRGMEGAVLTKVELALRPGLYSLDRADLRQQNHSCRYE